MQTTNKMGLVVASSFLALVGAVLAIKLRESPSEDGKPDPGLPVHNMPAKAEEKLVSAAPPAPISDLPPLPEIVPPLEVKPLVPKKDEAKPVKLPELEAGPPVASDSLPGLSGEVKREPPGERPPPLPDLKPVPAEKPLPPLFGPPKPLTAPWQDPIQVVEVKGDPKPVSAAAPPAPPLPPLPDEPKPMEKLGELPGLPPLPKDPPPAPKIEEKPALPKIEEKPALPKLEEKPAPPKVDLPPPPPKVEVAPLPKVEEKLPSLPKEKPAPLPDLGKTTSGKPMERSTFTMPGATLEAPRIKSIKPVVAEEPVPLTPPAKLSPMPEAKPLAAPVALRIESATAGVGDTWDTVSRRYYGTPICAEALKAFNRDYPFSSPGVRRDGGFAAGETLYIPPTATLEDRYRSLLRDPSPPTTPPPASVSRPF